MKNLSAVRKLAPFLIALFAFVLYIGTFRFEFVYDDILQVINNPLIRSWHNLPLLFKTDVWRFSNPNLVGNYWRPLFMVWLLINDAIFGLSPAGWHVTSALLHAAATYFSFRLIYRLSDDAAISAIAALIFAVHPVHLETVAWVSGATDSLMGLFYILSLLAFLKGWNKDRGAWLWFAVSALLFGLAALSKETALTLPVLVLGYVLLLGGRDQNAPMSALRRAAIPISMYVVVLLLYWFGRNYALAGIAHSRVQIGMAPLLMTWPSLFLFYLKLLVWPLGLSVFYGTTVVMDPTWNRFWLPLIAGISLIAMLAAWIARTKNWLIPIAVLLLVIPLGPAFIFPAIYPIDFAHDRYLYLPCLGFAVLVGIGIRGIASRFQRQWIAVAVAATLVLLLVAATSTQMVYWANNLLLFDRATRMAPGFVRGYSSLAEALASRGRTQEAMSLLEQVIKAEPYNQQALFNLGLGSFLDGRYQQSEEYLSRAAAVSAYDGDTFALLAESEIRMGKFAEAESAIRHAIAVKPYKPGYRRILALSLEAQGKNSAALEAAEAEARQHPEDIETQNLLARLKPRPKESQSDKKSSSR